MKRILIVEDDLAFGTMIQTWLKKKGFDVERVTSVGAAIKAMGAGDAFQLVLSDLRLPDHDGLVLLQHIRKSDAHLPFIVMTSYAEVQNAVCAMKSGASVRLSSRLLLRFQPLSVRNLPPCRMRPKKSSRALRKCLDI